MSSRDDPTGMDLHELHEAYADGRLEPVQVLRAHLDRLHAVGRALRCVITPMETVAWAQAEESAARWRAGRPLGWLDGIPVGLKDNIAVAGLRCTAGTAALEDWVPDRDATVVTRLREAGAVLIAKLNMHEAALGATSANPVYGDCVNPLRAGHTPGGSSGGSAAAVAAEMRREARAGPEARAYRGRGGGGEASLTPEQRASVADVIGQLKMALAKNLHRIMDTFREFDEDQSGKIDKREFRLALQKLGIVAHKSEYDLTFDSLDNDRSGTLEYHELHEHLRRRAGDPSQRDASLGTGAAMGAQRGASTTGGAAPRSPARPNKEGPSSSGSTPRSPNGASGSPNKEGPAGRGAVVAPSWAPPSPKPASLELTPDQKASVAGVIGQLKMALRIDF